jgi:hypothetical protein
LKETNITKFINQAEREIMEETASKDTLEKLAGIILVHIHYKAELNHKFQDINNRERNYAA